MAARAVLLLAVACLVLPWEVAAEPLTPARCRALGNDDRTVPYTPAFKAGFDRAFAENGRPPNADSLKTGVVRCMDRRLYGCLIGANQPCYKMDTRRDNKGANAFCRANPGADTVPLAASGHGSIYDYACHGPRATITRTEYTLDARGFAVGLWRPLD